MIHALTGKLAGLGHSQIYLNVEGVEYEIYVPLDVLSTLQKKADQKEAVHLHIYHHFRENEQRLFGFLDASQREFFAALLGLRGLGPSLALSLLSHLSGEELLNLCANNKLDALCRIPRVGKSTAESIVFEIKRQRKKWDKLRELIKEEKDRGGQDDQETEFFKEQEMALQALLQLGYREKEAEEALRKVQAQKQKQEIEPPKGAAEWIRSALQIL